MSRRWLGAAIFAFVFVVARGALGAGDGAPATLVVEVDPGARRIDPARLRAAIAAELRSPAVAPDEPGAAHAKGTIMVAADPAAGTLVVTYAKQAEHGASIRRAVALPSEEMAIEHAAVVLAGNLVRNEADEIVARLRHESNSSAGRAPPSQSSPPPSTTLGEAPEGARGREAIDDAEARGDLHRMKRIFAQYANHNRTARRVLSWTALSLGVAALGGDTYLLAKDQGANNFSWVLLGISTPLFISGVWAAPSTSLDDLKDYFDAYAVSNASLIEGRDAVEAEWRRQARAEARRRTLAGWLYCGLAVAGAAVNTGFLIYEVHSFSGANERQLLAQTAGAYLLPAVAGAFGVDMLTSDGPVESSLHAYERAIGRFEPPRESRGASLSPHIAFVPGGGAFGVSGSF